MTFAGQKSNLVMKMTRTLIITFVAVGLAATALPAKAATQSDSVFAAVEEEAGPKEKAKEGKSQKEQKEKKQYDEFKDKNGNGIDDRYEKSKGTEKTEKPKKKKKDEPGGEIQRLETGD